MSLQKGLSRNSHVNFFDRDINDRNYLRDWKFRFEHIYQTGIDGCPCESYECEYVCFKPQMPDLRKIEEPRVGPVTLHLNQGDFIGQEYRRAKFDLFKGIPFAEAPTGENRWRAPKPVQNWKVPKRGMERTPQCPQVVGSRNNYLQSEEAGITSEDCLFLDIWRPSKGYPTRLPILIWIHG